MKPTKSILILLSLFMMFSCDDKEEELPNELSLDWILLKRVIVGNFSVESCEGYEEGYCICNVFSNCGDCRLKTYKWEEIESCDGYDICEYPLPLNNNLNSSDCCSEINLENPTNVEGDCWVYQNCSFFLHQTLSMYEYKLYWNNDLSVHWGIWDSDVDSYDIDIPTTIPNGYGNCNSCEDEEDFHPNCDTLLDTTLVFNGKEVSFEKMGWLEILGGSNGYITYLRNEEYLQTDGDDIDISSYKIVDYQIKEY